MLRCLHIFYIYFSLISKDRKKGIVNNLTCTFMQIFFCLLLFVSFSFRTSILYFFLSHRKLFLLCDRHQQLILQGKVFIVFHHYWIANLNLSLFFAFSCGNFFLTSVPRFFFRSFHSFKTVNLSSFFHCYSITT